MLQAVAALCPDGFTIDKNTFEPINDGFSVAVADTQNSFGNYGAAKVVAYAAKHQEISTHGGWYNGKNGQFYLDAVIINLRPYIAVALIICSYVSSISQ